MRRSWLLLLLLTACKRPTPTARESCALADLPKLHWPLAGVVSRDFMVTAYFDADPSSPGRRDFKGFVGEDAITYDGHDGIDIGITGFPKMDRGVPIEAGLDAVVLATHDGEFDRQVAGSPPAPGNSVMLGAPNGFIIVYWHLRKGSIRVKPGDRVKRGQVLGEVGSSGKSSGPHLHIGASDCAGKSIDLMAASAFSDAPPYQPPVGLMNVRYSLTEDLGNEITASKAGQLVYVEYVFGNFARGDRAELTITGVGAPVVLSTGNDGRHIVPGMTWNPTFKVPAGAWTLTTKLNDAVVDRREWVATP